MSYIMGLDEYDEEVLAAEISRRQLLRSEGKCDYCKNPAGRLIPSNGNLSCKFPDRHYNKEASMEYNRREEEDAREQTNT